MNAEPTREVAVGVFVDQMRAQAAVRDLRSAGFREEEIGVAARNSDQVAGSLTEGQAISGTNVATGAGAGAATGAGVGALWALGIAAGVLPAIGPVIAGGLLAAVAASAAGGAAVAGVIGALVGLGIPEDEAAHYESEFKAGRTIVTVRAQGRYQEALAILRSHDGYDLHTDPIKSADR